MANQGVVLQVGRRLPRTVDCRRSRGGETMTGHDILCLVVGFVIGVLVTAMASYLEEN